MLSRQTAPVLYAGLAGAATFAVPTYAHAVEVFGADNPMSEAGLVFVAGCVSGALVASSVTVAVEHFYNKAQEQKAAKEYFYENASHAQGSQCAPKHAKGASAPAGRSNASFGRHSAAARAVDEWEKTGEIRMQMVPAPAPAHAAWDTNDASEQQASSDDYVDIADAYVQKITLAERLNIRARGVAEVLRERFTASKMEGMPIIQRADGSVADMGENWWESIAQESYVQEVSAKASDASRAQAAEDTAPAAPVAAPAQDLWSDALSALDDRFAEQIALGPQREQALFVDEIGDADTIDEPEGLEPNTMFMSFRPQAGHSELTDTSSYVDLLIDQEFSRNSSAAARNNVRGALRNYLKVIEGGTGKISHGKHFAASVAPVAQVAY